MVGIKPTRLWHHLCRKHFWWLINERIYARCPKRIPKKYDQIPDPCPQPVCPPHDHFNRLDMLKITGIVLAATGGLCYAFGHFDLSKYDPYLSSYECAIVSKEETEKKNRKIPCDERVPEEIPACICDDPDLEEKPKKWKKEIKPKCI